MVLGSAGGSAELVFLLRAVWAVLFLITAIINLTYGMGLYKQGDLPALRIFSRTIKWGLVPFWVLHFVVSAISIGLAAAAERSIFFATAFFIGGSYLILLTSSFYTLCYIFLLQKEKKVPRFECLCHLALQLCFVLDLIGLILLLRRSFGPEAEQANDAGIGLKYPVLFVHGAGFRDTIMGLNYWGRIPEYLQRRGIPVYFGGTDAWGSIESNGKILKEKIGAILRENNAGKINIIAHSRGGLESRYLITALQMDHAVASLTTISTPHRGVRAMNMALWFPLWLYRGVSFFVNGVCKIAGDKTPDFFTSSRDLSEKHCGAFNKKYPDNERVYYQSYASKLKYFFGDLPFIFTYVLLRLTDGDNDGLCPIESAKWGDFKGIITTGGIAGISHAGIVDSYRINYGRIDIRELYLRIVKELAARGL
jgi:triacylglycerol lipase